MTRLFKDPCSVLLIVAVDNPDSRITSAAIE
jgi:hypothetical protein